ncbi:TadE/TadG family type IV pilus assembly protein [Kiloniella sp.]|uniref:TadE/TadG family type IV pilus assembly protein n=1 Tax=Kiloniella sp. TaxID=1938587 RepID=UPI003B0159EC
MAGLKCLNFFSIKIFSLARLLRKLRQCERGVALVELALALPVFVIFLTGVIEMTRYVWINHKILRLTSEVSDLVTQSSSMSVTEMNVLFEAAEYIIDPFDMQTNGVIIVSSVSGTGEDPPQVNWRQCGAGNLIVPGVVGAEGTDANVPNGLVLNPLDNVIVAEVYYNYKPLMFDNILSDEQLSRIAIHSPRIKSLISILREGGQTDGC